MFYPNRSKETASENAGKSTSENASGNASAIASENTSEKSNENTSKNASVTASVNVSADIMDAERLKLISERRRPSKLVVADSKPSPAHPPSESTNESTPQASSMDPMDPNRSNPNNHPPQNKFISLCFHQILRFIKDRTQPNLQFHNLNKADTILLHTVFSSAIDDRFDNGSEAKRVCIQIWEAAKIRCLDFEFRITGLKGAFAKKSLLLEKRPRITKNESDKTSVQEDIFDRGRAGNRTLRPSILKHQERLLNLGSEYVLSTYINMLEFLKDDMHASITFPVSTMTEQHYIKNILNIARSEDIKSIFNKKARKIVDEVHRLADLKINYRVQMSNKWPTKGVLDIGFVKVPLGEKQFPEESKPNIAKYYAKRDEPPKYCTITMASPPPKAQLPRKRTIEDRNDQLVEALSVPVQSDKAMKMMLGMGWKGGALGAREDGITEPIMPHLGNSRQGLGHTNQQSKLRKIKTKVPKEFSAVSSERSSTETGTGSSAEPSEMYSESPSGSSPPAVPDPAITMQDTSASLLRKPVVHGSLPTSCAGKRSLEIFTKFFMEHVHSMMLSPEIPITRTLVFRYPLKKKEKFTVRQTLDAFVDKRAISVPRDLKQMYKEIVNEYRNDPMVAVTACLSEDKNNLTLEKSRDLNRAIFYETPVEKRDYVITDFETYEVQEFFDKYCLASTSLQFTDDQKFKIGYLLQTLKFVKNNSIDMYDVKLDYSVSSKFRFYTYHGIQRINETNTFCTDSPVSALSGEIKKYTVLGNYQLNVTFNDDKTMYTLIKGYNNKKTDLPVKKEQSKNTSEESNHTDTEKDQDVAENVDMITENIDSITEKLDDIFDKFEVIIKTVEEITENVKEITIKVEHITENSDITESVGKINENVTDMKENNNAFTASNEKTDNNGCEHEQEKGIEENLHFIQNPDVIYISDDSNVENGKKTSVTDDIQLLNNNNNSWYDNESFIAKTFDLPDEINENENTDEKDKDIEVREEPMNEEMPTKIIKQNVMIECSPDNMSVRTVSDDSAVTTNVEFSEGEDNEDISMSSAKLSDDKSVDVRTNKSENVDFKSFASETASKLDLEKQSEIIQKTDVKIVYLIKSYNFSKNTAKYIQAIISSNIMQTKEFPLLKCHGVQSNALVYSCHTKKSYEWLENVCVANNITIFTKEFDKMSMKINSFIDFDEKSLFDLLELYNKDITTKEWRVMKKEKVDDCIVFEVQMDKKSFQFVLDSNLTLFAGVVKITFNLIFD